MFWQYCAILGGGGDMSQFWVKKLMQFVQCLHNYFVITKC
jgi:hypothetical protein